MLLHLLYQVLHATYVTITRNWYVSKLYLHIAANDCSTMLGTVYQSYVVTSTHVN